MKSYVNLKKLGSDVLSQLKDENKKQLYKDAVKALPLLSKFELHPPISPGYYDIILTLDTSGLLQSTATAIVNKILDAGQELFDKRIVDIDGAVSFTGGRLWLFGQGKDSFMSVINQGAKIDTIDVSIGEVIK